MSDEWENTKVTDYMLFFLIILCLDFSKKKEGSVLYDKVVSVSD